MNIAPPTTSPPSSQRPLLASTFLNPTPLPFRLISTSRRRFSVSFPRCSSADADQPTTSTSKTADIFGGQKELTGFQPLAKSLPPPLRLVSSAILVAGVAAAGYQLGLRFGGNKNVALGGAAVLGAAGGAAAYAVNASVPEVAAVELHNYVAGCDDPGAIKKEDIDQIASNYGVSKQDPAFSAELSDLYLRFVSSLLPPPNEELNGNEVDTIIKFKSSLGIDDPEAASMHMEIGRRIFRERLETGDRDADLQQRRAFQRLIYVSSLVFGDASTFLLPWKRVFKVTDSQVEVAVRDNAQRLYGLKLKTIGRDLTVDQLISLRESQLLYRLSDELAEDLFKERCRRLAEENITSALTALKSRKKAAEAIRVVEELDAILSFNSLLTSLKNHADAERLPPGVGPVSLVGGEYDSDKKIDELKVLYRSYAADSLASGRIEANKLDALTQLKNIFGLGKREAEAITVDVTSKVYRKRLSQAFNGGDLEAADSKAAFLQKLCEELYFDPQRATQIHEDIYREKLQKLVGGGELSDEDVKNLLRLRVMLCIPQDTVEAAHNDVCGGIFEKIVSEAIASGMKGYDVETRKAVAKAAYGLRLSRDTAMSIASKAVKRVFFVYIKSARAANSRSEAAEALKKLIGFNAMTVTALVSDIKGEPFEAASEQVIEVEAAQKVEEEEEDEWDSIESLKKIKAKKDLDWRRRAVQTEINLKDDLPLSERTALYKRFLIHCLTGETVTISFGVTIGTSKRDDSEFLLLNQLGDLLGLGPKEIMDIHRGLAEQKFRRKAEEILADGQLTKVKIGHLNDLQKEVGLPPDYAQKLIKNITTNKLAGAIESAVNQGKLNMKQIRELKESGVDIDSMISDTLRRNLFKKTINEMFSSGTGEFDEVEVYEKIPADLKIDSEKAGQVVREFAQSRLSNSLIQAVALLRQKNRQGVVSSLNDMFSCDKAVPAKPLSWENQEELEELYAVYATNKPAPEKLSRIQYLLGISDSSAEALRNRGDKVPLVDPVEEEEEFAF